MSAVINSTARNACDFCIRGYSHGVYNRGQDSAGILMFEQCSGNVIAENSATHCGDGLFAFAGKEALGETEPSAPVPMPMPPTVLHGPWVDSADCSLNPCVSAAKAEPAARTLTLRRTGSRVSMIAAVFSSANAWLGARPSSFS